MVDGSRSLQRQRQQRQQQQRRDPEQFGNDRDSIGARENPKTRGMSRLRGGAAGGDGSGYGGHAGGYGSGPGGEPVPGERGYRRRKWAAAAGSVYRAGATAVNEIRETYAQQRTRDLLGAGAPAIPGSFPDVAITVQGEDQMVIFPSYAKHHVKEDWGPDTEHHSATQHGSIRDENFWRREWERNEDESAIVDVDVRGWIYSPHKGPLTRKNRILLGLARHLSGIPVPRADERPSSAAGEPSMASMVEAHESLNEQRRIAKQAAEIERRGREEKLAAGRGQYSETPPEEDDPDFERIFRTRSRSASPPAAPSTLSAPSSPTLSARTSMNNLGENLSDAELAAANANLMARIAPFLTTPFVQLPISIFFYNDSRSKSKTVMTNEAGHFVVRAALDFVPTHVRVLANERLSAIQEVKVLEPRGISLISDIDDTVKSSNISAGTKEIFRNTFVRDLADLTIDGVREWYTAMHQLGVAFHYCSNSPWQLFPVLASFFSSAGLPPGSLHLKQYTGMLQGIFEPVAERKRSTLTRIMKDFPERRFLLVGDSGEADLEVYTELAVANPGRILAIFIRDVTTPERPGFFDTSFDGGMRKPAPAIRFPDQQRSRSANSIESSTAGNRVPQPPPPPSNGILIDLSDEPEETKLDRSAALAQVVGESPEMSSPGCGGGDPERKAPPPPRPAKPVALRGTPSDPGIGKSPGGLGINSRDGTPPPEQPPSSFPGRPSGSHPLSQRQDSSQATVEIANAFPPSSAAAPRPSRSPANPTRQESDPKGAPPPPPPRRRGTPSNGPAPKNPRALSPRLLPRNRAHSANSDVDFEALPPPSHPVSATSRANAAAPPPRPRAHGSLSRSGSPSGRPGSPVLGPTSAAAAMAPSAAVSRRVDLWHRRLARAQETLSAAERQGHKVALYTWKTGGDVVEEAVGLVKVAIEKWQKQEQKLPGKGAGRR